MSVDFFSSRARFPRTELGDCGGDCDISYVDVPVKEGRDTPSSTNVASVSLEESVQPFSSSSSSSSRDVTNASFANSIVGVTAAVLQYSRFENRSAS